MKSKEQIEERIQYLEDMIDRSKSEIKVIENTLKELITSHIEDADYLQVWIPKYLKDKADCTADINKCRELISLLDWVFEDCE